MGDLEEEHAPEIAVKREKDSSVHDEQNVTNTNKANGLKLDPHGFPLQPQPTSDPMGKT